MIRESEAQGSTMSHEEADQDSSKHGRMSRAQMRAVLGGFGWYQRRLLLLFIAPLIMNGYRSLSVVVTFVSPEHRCQVPGLVNDTFSIQNDAHRMMVNLSIPMTSTDGDLSYSQCEVYKDSDERHANRTLYDDTESCDSWVYDDTEFERTIVTEFDLVCKNKGFRANFNMIYMVGLLVGSAGSGILCDRYGRKKVFVVGMMLTIATTTAMAFPVVTPMLLVYRFLSAVFGMISFLGLYVLGLEFMGPSKRTMAGSYIMIVYTLGPLLVGVLSYVITDWRWLQIINGVPFIFILSYWWILDESPRWLMTKGHVKEAQLVILKVVKVNTMTMPVDGALDGDSLKMEDLHQQKTSAAKNVFKNDSTQADTSGSTAGMDKEKNADETDKDAKGLINKQEAVNASKERWEIDEEPETTRESPLKLFKYPNLIARTSIIFFNWAAVTTTYFGLSLNVTNLAGSVRLNFLFSNLVDLVGCCIAWFLMDRLGRKRTHCACMLLAGIACLVTIFTVLFGGSDLQWVTVLLVMVGKLGISAAFSTVYLMSGELFPTVIRNMGMGFSSTVARVASALSPYIADLSLHIEGKIGMAIPLVIFGALALAAGLLALCLPETLNRKLPDTIQEAADFTRQQADAPVNVQQQTTDSHHSP